MLSGMGNAQLSQYLPDGANTFDVVAHKSQFPALTATNVEEGILFKATYKKALDNKIIQAGMFNNEASDLDRQKKLEELDAQLQKIETTRGAARTDALSEAVNKQAGTKLEKDDSVEEDIPESVKSESFEDESISGGASSKSVDLG